MRRVSLFLLILTIPLFGGILVPPARADDALLRVRGTEGSGVWIDKEHVGTIPLKELHLPEGKHEIEMKKSGFYSKSEAVWLRPFRGATVVLYLDPKTRRAATLRALAFPGWGAEYSERRTTALVTLGVQAAVVGFAIYQDNQFDKYISEFNGAQARYDSSVTDEEIAAAGEARDEAHDKASTAESRRDAAIVTAVAVQILSALEVWYHFPFTDEHQRIALTPVPGGGGRAAGLALRYRF